MSATCPFCVGELVGGVPSSLGDGDIGGQGFVTEWECRGCGAEIRRYTVLRAGARSDDLALRTAPRYFVPTVVDDAAYSCPTCNGALIWVEPRGVEGVWLAPPIHGEYVTRDTEWICADCSARILRRERGTSPSPSVSLWFITTERDGSQIFEPLDRAPLLRTNFPT